MNGTTLTPRAIAAQTNELINDLSRLAAVIDAEYSEACLDTGMTNRAPRTERERLVSALHALAFDLNGSGLADRETVALPPRYQDYGRDHRNGIGGNYGE